MFFHANHVGGMADGEVVSFVPYGHWLGIKRTSNTHRIEYNEALEHLSIAVSTERMGIGGVDADALFILSYVFEFMQI